MPEAMTSCLFYLLRDKVLSGKSLQRHSANILLSSTKSKQGKTGHFDFSVLIHSIQKSLPLHASGRHHAQVFAATAAAILKTVQCGKH